jgi:hypothetical protein
MEEKLLKEMITLLQDIKESVSVAQINAVRGPIADPGPDMFHGPCWPFPKPWPFPPLPVGGDPATSHLLPKEDMIKIKVKELDMIITQVSQQLDLLKVQKDLLVKEYKLG